MSWYIMNEETYEKNIPCRLCEKPIAVGDKYMLFGHKPPFEFSHAGCEWTKESAIAKAEAR